MKKRTNPRRRPATMADVKRAKAEAQDRAMRMVLYLLLYVLIEKHDASTDFIQSIAEDVNYYADSIKRGYVTWKDIERVVIDEYDVRLPW